MFSISFSVCLSGSRNATGWFHGGHTAGACLNVIGSLKDTQGLQTTLGVSW